MRVIAGAEDAGDVTQATTATILVVDDHEAARYAVSRMLRAAGYHTTEAATGGEALALAAEQPDLVLLDINLPDISGYEVCRRIKARAAGSLPLVLHLSATYMDTRDRVLGLDGGADGYLTGTVEPAELLATVRALLRMSEAEKAVAARARQQAAVAGLGQRALAGTPIGALLEEAANEVIGTLGVNFCGVWELEEDGSTLRLRAGAGWDGNYAGVTTIPAGTGSLAGAALLSASPLIVEDWDAETRFLRPPLVARHAVRSGIAARMEGDGRPTGALVAYSTRAQRFGPDDLHFLQAIANVLASALARGRAEAERKALLEREQAARAEAEGAARAREAFLARASHELRTPLTSALGTIRLLPRAIEGRLKEPPLALVQIAARNLEVMLTLIDQLLDASSLAAGGEVLAPEPVEIGAVVSRSLEVVGPQARARQVTLRVALAPGLSLSADPLKLEQVIINLLANAVKFTPAGGAVTVEAERSGDTMRVRVRDTGEGIAPDHLESIFEPFVQAGPARARRARGIGLGLAICRQMVALHGGRIHAESEGVGRGSTFTVELPLVPAESRGAQLSHPEA